MDYDCDIQACCCVCCSDDKLISAFIWSRLGNENTRESHAALVDLVSILLLVHSPKSVWGFITPKSFETMGRFIWTSFWIDVCHSWFRTWNSKKSPNISPHPHTSNHFLLKVCFQDVKWSHKFHHWLVVWTPLKNMKVNMDDYSQYIEKSKSCSSHHQPVISPWKSSPEILESHSIDWFKGQNHRKNSYSWENLWFPVKIFPFFGDPLNWWPRGAMRHLDPLVRHGAQKQLGSTDLGAVSGGWGNHGIYGGFQHD